MTPKKAVEALNKIKISSYKIIKAVYSKIKDKVPQNFSKDAYCHQIEANSWYMIE